MSILDSAGPVWSNRMLSVLRVVAAVLFVQHGTQKLFGLPPSTMGMAEASAFSLLWFAGRLEVIGGTALLLGVFTRPVALVLSGEMAVAYLIRHAPRDPWPIRNMGELAALFSFLFLYFAFVGGGAWSLDALIRRARGHNAARDRSREGPPRYYR
jgi:putative oxidoreductase